MVQLIFPRPSELWGDCTIEQWSEEHNDQFVFNLITIAAAIVYAEQPVIDRVNKNVLEIVERARSGEIEPDQAIEAVNRENLFTKEELENIHRVGSEQGQTVGEFFKNRNRPIN